MFEAEAQWLARAMARVSDDDLFPLVDIGCSYKAYREEIQPWIDKLVFAPLRERRPGAVCHVDIRDADGVDLIADILTEEGRQAVRALNPRAALCSNVLEHVTDPAAFAQAILDMLPVGAMLFVTGPYEYPYHRDPIDNMLRPTPEEVHALFPGTQLLRGEIINARASYLDSVRERPWIIFRHVFRFPFPFISFAKWKRSMIKLQWLFKNYRSFCVVLRKVA